MRPKAPRINPEQSCTILYVCLHARRLRQALEVMPFSDCQISSCKEFKRLWEENTVNILPGQKTRAASFHRVCEGTRSHCLCDVGKCG